MRRGHFACGTRENRRAQAALEYLITYGWGFLVILVVMGALAYFGFFSPTRYIPARCEFGAQLECVDYQLSVDSSNDAHIRIQFRNNFGDDIYLSDLRTVDPSDDTGPYAESPITATTIKKGNVSIIIDLSIDQNPANSKFIKGERITVPLVATFRRSSGTNLHNVTGEIFATIQ